MQVVLPKAAALVLALTRFCRVNTLKLSLALSECVARRREGT